MPNEKTISLLSRLRYSLEACYESMFQGRFITITYQRRVTAHVWKKIIADVKSSFNTISIRVCFVLYCVTMEYKTCIFVAY